MENMSWKKSWASQAPKMGSKRSKMGNEEVPGGSQAGQKGSQGVPKSDPGPPNGSLGEPFPREVHKNKRTIVAQLVPRCVKVGKAEFGKIIDKPFVLNSEFSGSGVYWETSFSENPTRISKKINLGCDFGENL